MTTAHSTSGSLPIDSDLDVTQNLTGTARPVHVRVSYLALVAAGGTIGTGAREALSLAFPPVAGVPVSIFAINIVGAFLLGVLLEALVRRGRDEGRRRTMRLLIGTGGLGGFTTYSTLATDTALLFSAHASGLAVLYAIATVLVGALTTWAGLAVAATHHRRRHSEATEA